MKLAYAGTVEMQRRLATHTHYAVRGTLPRAVTKQVAAATYHQVWWPPFATMLYSLDRPPVWDDNPDVHAYVDPTTRQPITTWAQAIDELSTPDAQPAHVVRLGTVDVRGIEGGTPAADRAIKYATKYLTKDLVDQTLIRSDPQLAHAEQLYRQLQVLPCSPRCANWLLYGVQPEGAGPDLVPGRCRGKVHQRKTLGYTGRRCLVSRNWSGKTLTDHRLDGRDWFRALTAGVLDDDQDQTDNGGPPDKGRYLYQLARRNDRDVDNLTDRIMRSIDARQRARMALRMVREGPPGAVPATPPPPLAVYTVQEVAHLLGLALGGTYTLIREGTIPAIKAGGRWVVPKKRFHAWLDGVEDQADEPDPPDVPATRSRRWS
jgi:excisionase family DNA binding protein